MTATRTPKSCALCLSSIELPQSLTLTGMPSRAQDLDPIDADGTDDATDLCLMVCPQCGLLQLDCEPVPYFREVVRAAGISPAMADFRSTQFQQFVSDFGLADSAIVEIGCGRGEYLSILQTHAPKASGIEYGESALRDCQARGLSVSRFYPGETTGSISGAPFAGFLILHFLEHVPDLRGFLKGIRANLTDGAVGLIEVPNADMILREKLVAELMVDHLYYFTERTLRLALEMNGFEVISCSAKWHEYNLSAIVRVRQDPSLEAFAQSIPLLRVQLDEFIAHHPREEVVVWGAGHQSFAALAMHELGDRIAYIVDSAPFKQGRRSPASRIPIRSPRDLFDDPVVQCVIVMAGSYSDEVISQIRRASERDLRLAVLRPHGLEPA